MKAQISSFLVVSLFPILASCVSSQPTLSPQVADQMKCHEYGFKEGTTDFSNCVMNLDQNRIAMRRQVAGAVLANRLR